MSSGVQSHQRHFKNSQVKSTLHDRLEENSRSLNELLYHQSPFRKKNTTPHNSESSCTSRSLLESVKSDNSNGEITFSCISSASEQSSSLGKRSVVDLTRRKQNLHNAKTAEVDINSNIKKLSGQTENEGDFALGVQSFKLSQDSSNGHKLGEPSKRLHSANKNIASSSKNDSTISLRLNPSIKQNSIINNKKVSDIDNTRRQSRGFLPVGSSRLGLLTSSKPKNNVPCPSSDSAIETASGCSFSSSTTRPVLPVKKLDGRNYEELPVSHKNNRNDFFSGRNESRSDITTSERRITRHGTEHNNINTQSVPREESPVADNKINLDDTIERELEGIAWTTVPVEARRRISRSHNKPQSRSSSCLLITPDLLIDDTAPDSVYQTMSELEKMIAKKYQQKRAASPHHRKQLHIIRRPQSVPAKDRAFSTPTGPILNFGESKGLPISSDTNANEPLYANTMASIDVIQKPPRPNTRRYVKRNSKLNPDAIGTYSNSKGFQTYRRDSDQSVASASERTSRRDHIKNIQRLFEVSSKDATIQTSIADISKSGTDTKVQSTHTLTNTESLPGASTIVAQEKSKNLKDKESHSQDNDPNVQMDEIFSRPKSKLKNAKVKNFLKSKKGKYHPSLENLSNLNSIQLHGKFKSMPNISKCGSDSEFSGKGFKQPNGKLSFSVVDIGDVDKLNVMTKNHFGNTEFDQLRKSKNKKSGAKSLEDVKKLFSSEPSLSFRQPFSNQFKGSTRFSSATTEYHTSLVSGIVNDDTLSDINPDIFDSDVAGSTEAGIFQSNDLLSKALSNDRLNKTQSNDRLDKTLSNDRLNKAGSNLDVSDNSRLTFVHSTCATPEPCVKNEPGKTKTSSQCDLDKSEVSESFTIEVSQVTEVISDSVTHVDLGSLNEETTDDVSSISSLISDQKSVHSHGFVSSNQQGDELTETTPPNKSVLNTTFSVSDEVTPCSSISQLETLKEKRGRLVKMDQVHSPLHLSPTHSPQQNLVEGNLGSENEIDEESTTLSIENTSFSKPDAVEAALNIERPSEKEAENKKHSITDDSPLYAKVQKSAKKKITRDISTESLSPKIPSVSVTPCPLSPPYVKVVDCVDDIQGSPPYATIQESKPGGFDDSSLEPYATASNTQSEVRTASKFGSSSSLYATIKDGKVNTNPEQSPERFDSTPNYEVVEGCKTTDKATLHSFVSSPSPHYATLEDVCQTEHAISRSELGHTSCPIYSTIGDHVRPVEDAHANLGVDATSSHYATLHEINAERSSVGQTASSAQTLLPQSSSQFSLYQSIDQVRHDHQKSDSGIQMEPCDSNVSEATGGIHDKEELYAKVGNFRRKGTGAEAVSLTRSSSDEADVTLFSDDEHGPPLPARRYKQESTLKSSKGVSTSKSSLLNKMGAIKNSTKSKIKSLRKAVSLERGLDNVESSETPSKAEKLEKSKSKLRKAPSLKSITALFGKKSKSKKEKQDQVLSVFDDSTEKIPTKGSTLSLSKKKLWSSAKSLETENVEAPTILRTIGKQLEINPDGSHLIELTKPPQGPIGFYIGRGTANYDYGIFVSRFSDDSLEKLFAGLMNVGDEILEVNQRPVRDLSLDDVYELMAIRNRSVLKVFPMSSRRDL